MYKFILIFLVLISTPILSQWNFYDLSYLRMSNGGKYKITTDFDDNLWIQKSNEVLKLVDDTLYSFDYKSVNEHFINITDITIDKNGKIWVVANGYIFNSINGNFNIVDSLENADLLAVESDNRYWVSVMSNLYKKDVNGWEQIIEEQESAFEIIKMKTNNENQLLFSRGFYQDLCISDNSGVKCLTSKNSGFIGPQSIWDFAIDSNNYIISAGRDYMSIYNIQEDNIKLLDSEYLVDFDKELYFRGVGIDNENGIWAVNKSSIFGYFQLINVREGVEYFPVDTSFYKTDSFGLIYGVSVNKNGIVWIATNIGLFKFDKNKTLINRISNNRFVAYPNPATERLYIDSDEPINNITITDLTGRTLLRKANIYSYKTELDLSNFTTGIYFLQVNNQVQKIVVE